MTVLSSCLLLVLCKYSDRIQGVGSAAVQAKRYFLISSLNNN